jgi:Domain of unknown function (DUF4389)
MVDAGAPHPSGHAPAAGYPASYAFAAPDRIANWRPLVNWLLAIPHLVVLYGLRLLSQVVAIVSWFVIVFTGRLPEGLAGVQAMCLRYELRVYLFVGFLRDDYPPFAFSTTAADPGEDPRVRVDFAPETADRNRLTVFFRLFLVLPHVVVLAVLAVAAVVAYLIAFFAVLFTGAWPRGLRDFVLGVVRWSLRVEAYFSLLTDRYPPFSLD